jgi:proline iminopeptidase
MRRVFETSIAGRNWTTDLGRVTQPILIVHGDHDAIPVAAAEQWRATLPNARLVLVADADHLPWLDRPEDFVRAVAAFFQEP